LRGTGVTAINVHPGGINTNIVHTAAAKIHRGVEKGKGRILIVPDAYLLDTVARVAPTHGYGAISTFGNALGQLATRIKRQPAGGPTTPATLA
jgi:NAD(P)-dependent dehydrogenase (short-subunit alcohol dehydrogenase family)